MKKPPVAITMACCRPIVIWQPYTEDAGAGEPALLIQADSSGLLVIQQEGREVLIQPAVLPELIKALKRMASEVTQ